MTNYNFVLVNADTDSISICKSDMSEFSQEEQTRLLKELNSQFLEHIKFEPDGYFETLVVLKAKNYILFSNGEIKIKGSALKSSKTETALKEFLHEVINDVVYDKQNLTAIYKKYIQEIMNVQEIKRWSSKKTLTEKMEESERTNEAKLREAIKDANLNQGDKFWVFFKGDDSLCLAENFDGVDYNREKLLKKIHKTAQVFSGIMNTKALFIDFSLKKNRNLLEEILK